jgi:uncharacterized protein (DUF433 family)
MQEAPGITVNRKVRFGKPVIKAPGSRGFDRWEIGWGMTVEEVAKEYDLKEDILNVLSYAAKVMSEEEIRVGDPFSSMRICPGLLLKSRGRLKCFDVRTLG